MEVQQQTHLVELIEPVESSCPVSSPGGLLDFLNEGVNMLI